MDSIASAISSSSSLLSVSEPYWSSQFTEFYAVPQAFKNLARSNNDTTNASILAKWSSRHPKICASLPNPLPSLQLERIVAWIFWRDSTAKNGRYGFSTSVFQPRTFKKLCRNLHWTPSSEEIKEIKIFVPIRWVGAKHSSILVK